MTKYRFWDAVGVEIEPGAATTDGGTILDLVDCDEHGWKVKVEYPEGTEFWTTRYIGIRVDGRPVLACDDVRVQVP